MSDDYVDVYFDDVIAKTVKAVLIEIDGDEQWVPRSTLDNDDDLDVHGGPGTLYVAEWFAIKEGLV